MATPQEILAWAPLFPMIPKKDVAKLAGDAHDRTFPVGAVLTEEEQVGLCFGVIVEGQASVSVRGQPASTLGPGDYFGEMAFFESVGYTPAEERADQDERLCIVLGKKFSMLDALDARNEEAHGHGA
jgi:CRP-like cAMP-binding protein